MPSMLRTRFGLPGVIATVALVFAMTGGAFAAKYLITSTKQIKPSVLKALKGNVGPAGAAGAAGPAGPAGPQGPKGDPGTNGANGKSVETGTATGAECPTGGATVQVAGEPATKKKICNGAEGAEGPEGSPWTAGGTLPSGETETGSWVAVARETAFGNADIVPISFPIPLAAPIAEAHYNEPETENCPGTAEEPEAKAGHLCLYQAQNFGVTFSTVLRSDQEFGGGAAVSGAVALFEGAVGNIAWGTWAVTAP